MNEKNNNKFDYRHVGSAGLRTIYCISNICVKKRFMA